MSLCHGQAHRAGWTGRWLACSEDRSRLDSERMVLPSCSMLPALSPVFLAPPTRLSSKLCPQSGVDHLSVQTRTPWSMPWCLPFALSSPLTPEAVSCVCLCVGTQSHCFTLGIFGKGWGGGGDGVGRLDPGVIWHPSLNSFLLGTSYPGQRPLL